MKNTKKEKTPFEELYTDELRDLYDCENRIVKALPKMIKAASSPELKRGLEEHLRQTERQVKRLEQIFANCDEKATAKKCAGMVGILEEGDELVKEYKDSDEGVLDAAIISACQKVEHYEIASYGTVRAFAEQLGDDEGARLLQETLDEEEAADKKLTAIAEKSVNAMAVQAGASSDD